MEFTRKQQEAQDSLNSIISKCWEDEAFKQELVANPVETIKKFTGRLINIPTGKRLIVNDQTGDEYVHINIPAKPNLDELELTDEQLEMVAGGISPTFIILAGVGTAWLLHQL